MLDTNYYIVQNLYILIWLLTFNDYHVSRTLICSNKSDRYIKKYVKMRDRIKYIIKVKHNNSVCYDDEY